MASELSAVIVNYRSAEMTIRCVGSILERGVCRPEHVIVLDNQSGDYARLADALPQCVVVESAENGGYGAGLNAAARHVKTDYMLCLNPDTYFEDSAVLRAPALFEADPALAVIGMDLFYPDGTRQYSGRRFYTALDILIRRSFLGQTGVARGRNERHLMKREWEAGKAFTPDWVIGTGFIVRKAAFDQVGGMDRDYFMYMEDVDLCLRLQAHGWKILAVPGMRLIHDHQRDSASGPLSRAGRWHLASLRTFWKKHGMPLF
ncbi:glycosyltransferase family 2 protein [Sphingosinithalassobacter sp. LHW66-3]|uniref:glycosyltransferase family 2 protein n=1 Tax=Sphingosinithalassobacter sp. LHW66-3 TaxID=3424718 RepID=UPI003D6B4AB1